MKYEDRDNLFNEIRENKEAYKDFIEREIMAEEKYAREFNQNPVKAWNDFEETFKRLNDEKEKLDEEYRLLKRRLMELITNV